MKGFRVLGIASDELSTDCTEDFLSYRFPRRVLSPVGLIIIQYDRDRDGNARGEGKGSLA